MFYDYLESFYSILELVINDHGSYYFHGEFNGVLFVVLSDSVNLVTLL